MFGLVCGGVLVTRSRARRLLAVKTLSRFVRPLDRPRGRDLPRVATVAYKLSADVVSKGVTLAVFVVAARRLPGDELGLLALAMTTGWLLAVASDAGLPLDLARRMARAAAEGTRRDALVVDVMWWRVRLGLVAAGTGLAVGTWLAPPSLVAAFTLIVTAQLLAATLETLSHAFRGLRRSDIEASVTLAQRGGAGLAACGVLLLRPSLAWLAAALVVPPAIALGVSWVIVRRLTVQRDVAAVRADAGLTLAGRFLRDVAPMGLGIFLSALYFRCDVFFIERWHGLETVGVYNAAFRSVEALRLVPAALMAVVFPSLCTAQTLAPLRTTVTWLLAAAALPALVLAVAAGPILETVYGAPFVAAAPALRVLAWALPLFFLNYALTHQVLAWNGQRPYLGVVAAALVTSVAANLALVPSGGMRGAATATLLTEVVVAAGCLLTLAVQTGRSRTDIAPDHLSSIAPDGAYAASLPGDPA
jgi:O-antigen/teichoic acid export membrane protein